jgi:hypothetical protein
MVFPMKCPCFTGPWPALPEVTPLRSPSAVPTWLRSCRGNGRGVRETRWISEALGWNWLKVRNLWIYKYGIILHIYIILIIMI